MNVSGNTQSSTPSASSKPLQQVRRYDIIKEATVAFLVVLVLTFALAIMFSSPDTPPVTVQAWAKAQPAGFADIALQELENSSNSATYGPPYNHGSGSVQSLFGISIQEMLGVAYPVDPRQAFVLEPLQTLPQDPPLDRALHLYEAAPASLKQTWENSYASKLAKLPLDSHHVPVVAGPGNPVPVMITSLLSMAQSGALDAQLIAHSSFYTTNYTNPILFLGDSWKAQHTSSYWGEIVASQHLIGSQWGVMNETGSWPGQPWLWLYTMWYQINPFASSSNGDAEVFAVMAVLSLALLFVPFIPGLRRIPELIPVHRLVWRSYYRRING
jgi:hypothetical protein